MGEALYFNNHHVALISAIADVSKLYHHTVNVVVKWHSVLVRLFWINSIFLTCHHFIECLPSVSLDPINNKFDTAFN